MSGEGYVVVPFRPDAEEGMHLCSDAGEMRGGSRLRGDERGTPLHG
jgi:hypothetical protein